VRNVVSKNAKRGGNKKNHALEAVKKFQVVLYPGNSPFEYFHRSFLDGLGLRATLECFKRLKLNVFDRQSHVGARWGTGLSFAILRFMGSKRHNDETGIHLTLKFHESQNETASASDSLNITLAACLLSFVPMFSL